MSHEALNGEQFADHIHPHQLAIPGMEQHAHPWAGPLSRGYMLDMEKTDEEHHLAAVDVSHPKYPTSAAELSWATEKKTGYEPGEVTMVHNFAGDPYGRPGDPRAKGLAGALFHSAHRWNFGQSTVPIHSTERTLAGEHFANKVRPDLKPDVWHLTGAGGDKEVRAPGKPDWAPPEWEGVGENFHPYEKERAAKQKDASRSDINRAKMIREGHQQLFDTSRYRKKRR